MHPASRGILRGGAIEKLFTSHWRSSLLADVDAQIVSISRGEPRWRLPFAYRRLRSLAPCDEAWQEESTERFEAAYTRQLEELGAQRILDDLGRIGGGRPVVALCWERPHEPFCHRWVLSRWLHEQTGIEVPELRAGDLPQSQDAPEMRLF